MNQFRPAARLPSPGRTMPAWMWALPVFSCCMLGFVPPIVVAAKSRTRSAALWAAAFTTVFLIGFVLVGIQPEDSDNIWTRLGASLVVVTGLGGACYGAVMGPKLDWGPRQAAVYAPPPMAAMPRHDPNESAVAGVLAARQKRAEARALAQRDPQMARDLRIGRPDLPRHFDDGGLVDVNSAPAEAIAQWLGLSEEQATNIVEVRQQLGRFERVDDLLNLAGLELSSYDQASERIIVM